MKRGLSNFFSVNSNSKSFTNTKYIEYYEGGMEKITMIGWGDYELFITELGYAFPPCSKCGSNIFRLWLEEKSNFELSCVRCENQTYKGYFAADRFKRANIIKDEERDEIDSWEMIEPVDMEEIILDYIDLVKFIETYIKKDNHYIFSDDSIVKGSKYYDYVGDKGFELLKSTNPLAGSITFEVFGESEMIKKEETLNKRRRSIPQKVMDKVWNRDGGKCVECSSNENLEFDHIIPFSKGGANTYRNIQLLCENCNRIKSDKIG